MTAELPELPEIGDEEFVWQWPEWVQRRIDECRAAGLTVEETVAVLRAEGLR
jgi:hypothetical protein